MLFIDNKYTRWYYCIVTNAQTRKNNLEVYTEKHHIIPRSLGGEDVLENLVKLTAREHFICHRLLAKMTTGLHKRSMCYAAWQMTLVDSRERYIPNARVYAVLRKQLSESYKGIPKKKIHWLGKKHTDETKKKQSLVKMGKNNPMWGKPQSQESKDKKSVAQKGRAKPKLICPHCNKIIGGHSNYVRWHGDNCSLNTSVNKELQNH